MASRRRGLGGTKDAARRSPLPEHLAVAADLDRAPRRRSPARPRAGAVNGPHTTDAGSRSCRRPSRGVQRPNTLRRFRRRRAVYNSACTCMQTTSFPLSYKRDLEEPNGAANTTLKISRCSWRPPTFFAAANCLLRLAGGVASAALDLHRSRGQPPRHRRDVPARGVRVGGIPRRLALHRRGLFSHTLGTPKNNWVRIGVMF